MSFDYGDQIIRVTKHECPRATGRAAYDGRCFDGICYPEYGSDYDCPECGGTGYILGINKQDLAGFIKEVLAVAVSNDQESRESGLWPSRGG
jgi:hypothetical protein